MTDDARFQEAKKLFERLNAALKEVGKKLDQQNRRMDQQNKRMDKLEKVQYELMGMLDEGGLPLMEELLEEIQGLRKDARNPLGPLAGLLKGMNE